MFDNNIFKTPIERVIHEEQVRRDFRKGIVLSEKQKLSRKELILKLCNTSYNKKWPDGRIYSHTDDSGNVSHSVSPYSPSFLENIEDEIKGIVEAIVSKGYFPISSCQSHSIHEKRFIMLVFPTKDAAQYFIDKIPYKLKFNIKHCTDVLNVQVDADQYGRIKGISKKGIDTNLNNLANALEYVNCFIRRNYQDAWFLELILVDAVPPLNNFIDYIKYLPKILYKKYLINRHTRKLEKYIKSNKFPKNIY